MPHHRCLKIPQVYKDQLQFLFLAKHAHSQGLPDATDGTHAVYHHELLTTLRQLGLNVEPANQYSALFKPPQHDFLITLLNRGGFRNSEILAPLLAEMHGLPYWGGAPMVRGLSDDKHFMKRLVQALGLATPPWQFYPVGGYCDLQEPAFEYPSLIVKPNASSASWGVRHVDHWKAAKEHIQYLHREGHDALVECFIDGFEINAPVVGAGSPWYLPVMQYCSNSGGLRSYEEKRDLVMSDNHYVVHSETTFARAVQQLSVPIVNELWPFDHGRLEFRVEHETGRLWFIEINLNCNLWSRKAISSAARYLGVEHSELVETILCHSLLRQGLIQQEAMLAA